MNKSTPSDPAGPKRRYDASHRHQAADETRARILQAARALMGARGIDAVTIAEIGRAAGVAGSTVYAIFRSKEGLLRALMEQSLFGLPFRQAQHLLDGVTDPVERVVLTARVARAIYESEAADLGLIRHASGFSPALRAVEQDFEDRRLEMQRARVEALQAAGRLKPGLSLDEARRVMWMLTGRAVYAALVQDGGWSVARYEAWLEEALRAALVGDAPG